MRSSGDKDELSEKEKKNQKWYTVNRKKMILIAISNLIQSFFFFFFGSNYIALCNVMKLNDYGKIVRLD